MEEACRLPAGVNHDPEAWSGMEPHEVSLSHVWQQVVRYHQGDISLMKHKVKAFELSNKVIQLSDVTHFLRVIAASIMFSHFSTDHYSVRFHQSTNSLFWGRLPFWNLISSFRLPNSWVILRDVLLHRHHHRLSLNSREGTADHRLFLRQARS